MCVCAWVKALYPVSLHIDPMNEAHRLIRLGELIVTAACSVSLAENRAWGGGKEEVRECLFPAEQGGLFVSGQNMHPPAAHFLFFWP